MIVLEQLGHGVAKVTIENPAHHNALDGEMFVQLAAVWKQLDQDCSVRSVVITGAGDRAFCTGADLSQSLHKRADIDDLVDRALLKATLFKKPLIAAINGHCVAGGLELALAADIRIVSRTAQLGFPEVRWGILPSGGGAMKLLAQLPHAHAMDLLLTARLISGDEAARIGLATLAVDEGNVLSCALERAEMIARNSPIAVQATKQAALQQIADAYASREEAERVLVRRVRESGHQDEGIAAFIGKREPRYSAG
ncbi:MAG: enoyl-CoA hydratase-related protein [Burkholderiaceae bacterium]